VRPAGGFPAPEADGPDAGECLGIRSWRSAVVNADVIIADVERMLPVALRGEILSLCSYACPTSSSFIPPMTLSAAPVRFATVTAPQGVAFRAIESSTSRSCSSELMAVTSRESPSSASFTIRAESRWNQDAGRPLWRSAPPAAGRTGPPGRGA
jgi:hypothetical protein